MSALVVRAAAVPLDHLSVITRDAIVMVVAALRCDDSLQIISCGESALRMLNKEFAVVTEIHVGEIATDTCEHGNPRLSALTDLLAAFAPLKAKHAAAFRAIRRVVWMSVNPDDRDELLG